LCCAPHFIDRVLSSLHSYFKHLPWSLDWHASLGVAVTCTTVFAAVIAIINQPDGAPYFTHTKIGLGTCGCVVSSASMWFCRSRFISRGSRSLCRVFFVLVFFVFVCAAITAAVVLQSLMGFTLRSLKASPTPSPFTPALHVLHRLNGFGLLGLALAQLHLGLEHFDAGYTQAVWYWALVAALAAAFITLECRRQWAQRRSAGVGVAPKPLHVEAGGDGERDGLMSEVVKPLHDKDAAAAVANGTASKSTGSAGGVGRLVGDERKEPAAAAAAADGGAQAAGAGAGTESGSGVAGGVTVEQFRARVAKGEQLVLVHELVYDVTPFASRHPVRRAPRVASRSLLFCVLWCLPSYLFSFVCFFFPSLCLPLSIFFLSVCCVLFVALCGDGPTNTNTGRRSHYGARDRSRHHSVLRRASDVRHRRAPPALGRCARRAAHAVGGPHHSPRAAARQRRRCQTQ
jgi:hypothetical protein